jgi:hypothetical protein
MCSAIHPLTYQGLNPSGRLECFLNYSNFKAYDLNPRSQRLWPSEAVWQSWILAGDRLPSFDPSSLRIIARTVVINLSARRAIWYAARRSTSLVEDPSTSYAIYTKEGDGFYAILEPQLILSLRLSDTLSHVLVKSRRRRSLHRLSKSHKSHSRC